jgi:hypothetical protein
MTDLTTVVDRYFAVWNEPCATERAALIASVWTDDASYVDPLVSGSGSEGISALVNALHAQLPGHRFRLVGAIDGHHDRPRFAWELVGPGRDTPVFAGTDFGVIAADGRLRSVTGFLDFVPAPNGVQTDR